MRWERHKSQKVCAKPHTSWCEKISPGPRHAEAAAAPALGELSEVGDPEGRLMWTQPWLRWLALAKQTGFCTQLLVDIEAPSS